MKKHFHKALSLLMAFVVLFSTMSFTVSSHYCGESLVDSAVFAKVKSCGMESENPVGSIQKSADCSVTKMNCCHEESQIIKGQDELKISFTTLSFDQQIFVAAFFQTYRKLSPSIEDAKPSLKAFPPPLIVRHLYKLDETYLI